MGWLTHYCGDMYSHQFINVHSYGWMPGIGQIVEDVKELIDTDDLGDLVAFLDAHLPEGTINEYMETKDFSGIAKKVLSDPDAVKDLIQMLGDSFSYDYGDGELRKQLDEIIGAALKNVIALCAGIVDGLGMGDNTKAALMTRGLEEIARLGKEMGANRRTFAGLSGMGDLMVTCGSMHSRNLRAGILIGRGETVENTIRRVGTVEGYLAARAAWELACRHGVDMPIVEHCYRICYEGMNPRQALKQLLERPFGMENDGM